MKTCSEDKTFTIESERHERIIVKSCHCCGHSQADVKEVERCEKCFKSFLPLKYFEKIHDVHQNFSDLFSEADELSEMDLIKGLTVLW